VFRRVAADLPHGRLLTDALWQRRHRWITGLLWLHVPALLLFAWLEGWPAGHSLLDVTPVLLLAAIASMPAASRSWRSAAAALGLVTCSALVVHLWHGQIEGHFHFFVVVSLLILYQDWVPFLLAIGFVVLHHGIMGTVAPAQVFAHPGGVRHPWLWALIHGGFVLAVAAANIVSWRENEQLLRDPLTGLPSRIVLLDRLRYALGQARRRNRYAAVIFLDLDRFKVLNDSLGHDVGDRMLVEVSHRLRRAVRPSDTAVRFGGDEFLVVCEDLSGPEHAVGVANRIAEVMREPHIIDGRELVTTVSMGIAIGADDDRSAEDLVRDADAAMYRAKELGKDQCVVFDDGMRAQALARLECEADMRHALANGELCLHYQPEFDIDGGPARAIEALVRWKHPTRGLVAPREFIPTAEDTGLIIPIGEWVLREACRQLALWREESEADELTVRVNVSARQLRHPGLVPAIAAALQESSIPPARLCLEVTETAVMHDVEQSLATLESLRELGVGLALDDFGTGYSSLSYLRDMRFDVLKIDQIFVRDIGTPGGNAIMRAIVDMAHSLGTYVTAEGVETMAQLKALRDMRCDAVQGFLLARPDRAVHLRRMRRAPAVAAVAQRATAAS
jgi:diguanylate cyclase